MIQMPFCIVCSLSLSLSHSLSGTHELPLMRIRYCVLGGEGGGGGKLKLEALGRCQRVEEINSGQRCMMTHMMRLEKSYFYDFPK